MNRNDYLQERQREQAIPTCCHCQQTWNLRYAHCNLGTQPKHCETHRGQCELCKEIYCCSILIETEDGNLLCEECKKIEDAELMRASRQASRTGTRKDLHEYLRQRKVTNDYDPHDIKWQGND